MDKGAEFFSMGECLTVSNNERRSFDMAISKDRKKMIPEQAKSKIVESLESLSENALNELAVFVDFLLFKEGERQENVHLISEEEDYDISEFAGMLKDLTPEEMQRFEEALSRRPLRVKDRKISL